MDDRWYKLMEARFGPAYPFEEVTEYWTVENIGFSDPKRPSWFVCMRGRDEARFKSEDEATAWGAKYFELNKIPYRITHRASVEKYYYPQVDDEDQN